MTERWISVNMFSRAKLINFGWSVSMRTSWKVLILRNKNILHHLLQFIFTWSNILERYTLYETDPCRMFIELWQTIIRERTHGSAICVLPYILLFGSSSHCQWWVDRTNRKTNEYVKHQIRGAEYNNNHISDKFNLQYPGVGRLKVTLIS